MFYVIYSWFFTASLTGSSGSSSEKYCAHLCLLSSFLRPCFHLCLLQMHFALVGRCSILQSVSRAFSFVDAQLHLLLFMASIHCLLSVRESSLISLSFVRYSYACFRFILFNRVPLIFLFNFKSVYQLLQCFTDPQLIFPLPLSKYFILYCCIIGYHIIKVRPNLFLIVDIYFYFELTVFQSSKSICYCHEIFFLELQKLKLVRIIPLSFICIPFWCFAKFQRDDGAR